MQTDPPRTELVVVVNTFHCGPNESKRHHDVTFVTSQACDFDYFFTSQAGRQVGNMVEEQRKSLQEKLDGMQEQDSREEQNRWEEQLSTF